MELLRAGNSVIVAMIHSAMTRVVSPKATPKDDVHVLLLMVQSAHLPRKSCNVDSSKIFGKGCLIQDS